MAIRIVQSKQNTRVKELRSALLRPARTDAEAVAIEGVNLLAEAIRSNIAIETIFIAQGHEALLDELEIAGSIEILALPAEVLASAVSTETPQPIAALVRRPTWNWQQLLTPRALLIVLAGVQDPGNLGTILRSAEAFGATGAISLPGTVSHWNAKAVRASAGSVFRLPLLTAPLGEYLAKMRQSNVQTFAAMAHQATPLDQADLTGPIAFLIGSEGNGLSAEIAAEADARITIPCPGPVESLNAAVAASILLYEAARQRNLQHRIKV
ncbi:TrmH family RNA methyltransferase [Acidicapsa ligni]|uniref:TrmH family RNA methyltransferase n=1 Tax=Acidicapsa ligni TaxID=542300 RepID=UPI0021E08650|nr:RNA methyltransferase [Acidicapsa ligni]